METNNALSVLAQNIDRTRSETEYHISQQVRSAIFPLMEKFRNSKHFNEFRIDLEVLMNFMEDLLSGLSSEAQIARVLSPTELRVAALIKNGLSTDEIAQHMFVSPCTIKAHRRNIRKKLSLGNSSRNLKSFLRTQFETEGIEGVESDHRSSAVKH